MSIINFTPEHINETTPYNVKRFSVTGGSYYIHEHNHENNDGNIALLKTMCKHIEKNLFRPEMNDEFLISDKFQEFLYAYENIIVTVISNMVKEVLDRKFYSTYHDCHLPIGDAMFNVNLEDYGRIKDSQFVALYILNSTYIVISNRIFSSFDEYKGFMEKTYNVKTLPYDAYLSLYIGSTNYHHNKGSWWMEERWKCSFQTLRNYTYILQSRHHENVRQFGKLEMDSKPTIKFKDRPKILGSLMS